MCELLEPGSSSNPSFPCQSDSAKWTRASDYLAPPDRSPASGRVSFWNNCLSNSFPWSLCNLVGKPNFKTKSPKIFWAALLADLRFRWRKSTESSSKGCFFLFFSILVSGARFGLLGRCVLRQRHTHKTWSLKAKPWNFLGSTSCDKVPWTTFYSPASAPHGHHVHSNLWFVLLQFNTVLITGSCSWASLSTLMPKFSSLLISLILFLHILFHPQWQVRQTICISIGFPWTVRNSENKISDM